MKRKSSDLVKKWRIRKVAMYVISTLIILLGIVLIARNWFKIWPGFALIGIIFTIGGIFSFAAAYGETFSGYKKKRNRRKGRC